MMSFGSHRILLWSITVAFAVAGICALLYAAVMPLTAAGQTACVPPSQHLKTATPARIDAISFADVADFNLRWPISDSKTSLPLPSSETPSATAPPVQLVGTIDEPGHSLGIFRDSAGKCMLKSVGQDVAGAIVWAVTQRQAILHWQGAPIVLSLPAGDAILSAAGAGPTAASPIAMNPPGPSIQPQDSGLSSEGVSTDERAMRALLNRKLTLDKE